MPVLVFCVVHSVHFGGEDDKISGNEEEKGMLLWLVIFGVGNLE